MKWSDVLSVVSSIASITGMSLLTAGTFVGEESPRQLAWIVTTTICTAMFCVGWLYAVAQGLLWVDRSYLLDGPPSVRFISWCFFGSFSLFFSVIFLIGAWYTLESVWTFRIA
ncbi:hypothetical protein [Pseudomonas viridiflava]|uniref:hypothetical protein n=1 Tax=Pseudomonas viridiflava TaxID=33069 RepID=UPI0013CF0709|nr:hypothetical protein [Pseudomonas viridiflava]WKW30976.1 hypothetical protein KIH13_19590 [Pseudomonas viridiflava]